MYRVSKMTDYATVLLAELARAPELLSNARDLAKQTRLQTPTVSKILKQLTKQGLLRSQLGAQGGYQLAQAAEHITLADVVQAMEGQVAVTDCCADNGHCSVEAFCDVRGHWQMVTDVIKNTLANVSLADLLQPNHAGAKRCASSSGQHVMHAHGLVAKSLTQQSSSD